MTWGAYDIVIKYHSIYLTINKIGFKECTLSIFAVVDISDFSWKRSHTEGTLVCNTDSWHYSGGLRSKIKISLKINIPQQFRKMFQERLPVMKEGYFVRGTVILLEFLLFILLREGLKNKKKKYGIFHNRAGGVYPIPHFFYYLFSEKIDNFQ